MEHNIVRKQVHYSQFVPTEINLLNSPNTSFISMHLRQNSLHIVISNIIILPRFRPINVIKYIIEIFMKPYHFITLSKQKMNLYL